MSSCLPVSLVGLVRPPALHQSSETGALVGDQALTAAGVACSGRIWGESQGRRGSVPALGGPGAWQAGDGGKSGKPRDHVLES